MYKIQNGPIKDNYPFQKKKKKRREKRGGGGHAHIIMIYPFL